MKSDSTKILNSIPASLQFALRSVQPIELFKSFLKVDSDGIEFSDQNVIWKNFDKIHVWSVGKPAVQILDDFLDVVHASCFSSRLAITKYGHSSNRRGNFDVLESAHPIPDKMSLSAADELISRFGDLGSQSLVIGLISGGGSALMEKLMPGLDWSKWIQLTESLLKSGANIHEINLVRSAFSELKRGRLLNFMNGARSLNFIFSDVVGNRLESVSSGMTVPEKIDFEIVRKTLEKYGQSEFLKFLERRKDLDKSFNVQNVLVGSNQRLLDVFCKNLSSSVATELVDFQVDQTLLDQIRDMEELALLRRGKVFVWGGEVTHHVTGNGKGGRNQELALRLGYSLYKSGLDFVVFSIGTDGTDGPTDAAGGICFRETFQRAQDLGLSVENHIQNNDSYHFLSKTDSLLKTGPTGVNYMDLYGIVVF
ncbi:MAG: DUF4147 domain-containing protein [Bdellovibrionales bacterium]|nr:DUF4147 domain-containing protein [Bdellovibrionales bacterium]